MRAFVFDMEDRAILVLADNPESARKIALNNYPELDDDAEGEFEPETLLRACPVREVGIGDSFSLEI